MKSHIYELLFKNKTLITNKIKNKELTKHKIIKSKIIKHNRGKEDI